MKLLLVLLCAALSFFSIKSQAQTQIQGRIHTISGEAIPHANVLLLAASDSILVKGVIANEEGAYSFTNIAIGSYIIASSSAGFKQVYTASFKVNNANDNIRLDNIQLPKEEVELAAVTVTAKKPLFEQKIDRMVINVASSITYAGSTALDVLERSPGVTVDRQNNNISINSKSGVVVMINGKISRMPMSAVVQLLAGMSSDNIEKMEIITTPPANFDAEGNAGYLNIVLKSNHNYGTNGSYSATLGYNKGEETLGSININHRKGKVNLYGDYSYTRQHMNQVFEFSHAISNQGKLTENSSRSDRDAVQIYHDARIGLDYELSKKTIIGGLVNVYFSRWTMDAANIGRIFINKQLDTLTTVANDEKHNLSSYSTNLNLQHSFTVDEKLTFNLDYLYYRDNNPVNYLNSYFNGSGNFSYAQNVRSSKITPVNFWVGTADYSKKLSKKTDVEAGAKITVSNFNNNVQIERIEQNIWKTDPSLSAEYQLKENIAAAYSSFTINLSEKMGIKMGLRYEYTNSNLGSVTQKNIVDRQYGRLFPSFFFSNSFNENNAINFSYSRRITRPTFWDMAPFVIFVDPNTFFSGNTALQPSISDGINAAYTYKKKILSFSYSYTADPITNFSPKVDATTNKQTLSAENMENMQTFNINLSLPFMLNKWWNMQNNLSGSRQSTKAFYNNEPISLENKNYSINTTQSFKLPKDFSMEVSGFYYSGGLFGFYKVKPYGSLDFGTQKKLKHNKGNLRAGVSNILNSQKIQISVDQPQHNLVIKNQLQFGFVNYRLTYTRNFGSDKVKGKRERVTGAEDEKRRVQ
jgi:outer membrane receptor protein involved in Fe transport